MANRSITVTLRANVQDFKSQFDSATKAAEQTAKATETSAKQAETSMGRMVQSAQQNQAAWTTAGTTLTAFGAATLGGLGLATKAAMDWESAWAGVQKTVDGTAPQMAVLETGLRGLARELPATHQEIAAVAEAAGALGVESGSILTFTRTMIDLGETTNLSSDQAATSLARFMNIMGTATDDVGRLGSTLVGLGNAGASTESEIMDLGLRLAGAGAQAGLSEGEILGMANALSSVGIEAEAGGTAMSMTMKRIEKAVDEGGESLELFAQVSGMSAEQFASMWETRPAEAMATFVEGLGRTEQMGMSTNAVLTELGITGIRESDALLRMSSAGDILATSMAQGNSEFEKGNALIEEAAKRYETAESKIAVAGNAIVDAGISMGAVFLPAVAGVAEGAAELAGSFADLPAPIHAAIGGLTGIVGASSLAAGGFLLIFPRVMETVSAFKTLGTINAPLASGLGKVGKAAGVAAGAFVVLAGASAVAELFSETAVSAEEMTSKLANLAATTQVTAGDIDEMVAVSGTGGASVRDFGYAIESVNMGGFMKALDSAGSVFGLFDSDVSLAKEQIASLDQTLATFANAGTMDHLTETFNAAVESASAYGYTAEDIVALMPGLQTALAPIATELGLEADAATIAAIATGELVPPVTEVTGAAGELAGAMGEVAEAQVSAGEAAENHMDSLMEQAGIFIDAERAAMDYKDALEETTKAADENGKHWEDGTEKADENKRALLDLAEQAQTTADAFTAENNTGGTFLQQAREDLIDVATEMTGSRELAEAYVDQLLGTPEEITTQINFETQAAKDEWTALWDEMGTHPPLLPIGADTTPAEDSLLMFDGLVMNGDPSMMPVDADTTAAQEEVTIWGSQVGDVPTTPVAIDADPTGAIIGADEAKTALGSIPHVTRTESGLDIGPLITQADQAYLELAYLESQKPTPTADLNDTQLVGVAGAAVTRLNEIDGMEPTPELRAEKQVLERVVSQAQGRINGMTGKSVDVEAHAQGFGGVANLRAEISRLQSKWVTIGVRYQQSGTPARGAPVPRLARAGGGPIYGPGTGTSDSVPVAASNGEHMLTAREVSHAGGHQAIYSLRQQLLAGARTLHLASGGGIENGSVAPVRYAPVIQQGRAQNVSASVDMPGIFNATKAGVLAGFAEADITATVTDRVAAGLHQRGKSASRAFGGAK